MLIPSTNDHPADPQIHFHSVHPCTIHWLDFEPMDDGGRYSIQPPNVSNLPAHAAHFNSADYRAMLGGRNHGCATPFWFSSAMPPSLCPRRIETQKGRVYGGIPAHRDDWR